MLGRETRIPRTLSSDEISTNQFATLDLINVLSPHYRNPMFTNTFCASGGRRLTDHCDTQPIFSESGLRGARTGEQSGGNTQSGQAPFYSPEFSFTGGILYCRFALKRVRKERKPVKRTDSKLWRKQQSGENSDTK